jgi:hypothetical protein
VTGESSGLSPAPSDDRSAPPFLARDRESLESWLDFYRTTLPLKVGGLAPAQLCTRSVPPSTLTLIGIVRHLTGVENYWFTEVVAAEHPEPMFGSDDPDADFNEVDPSRALADLARFEVEIEASRVHSRAVADLNAPLPVRRHGNDLNLRWVYVHMIEEYARHLGHADLLRECLDGVTGY